MDLSELKKRLEESLKAQKEEIARQKKETSVLEAHFNNELSQFEQIVRQYLIQPKESMDFIISSNQKSKE